MQNSECHEPGEDSAMYPLKDIELRGVSLDAGSDDSSMIPGRQHGFSAERHSDSSIVARGLIVQASPSLLMAVAGSVFAGLVLEKIQNWQAFRKISELFILVPVLLHLKGCIEMNLAARMSTSANMGELDYQRTRKAFVSGNLMLIQVQALAVAAFAGLWAFTLGYITKPHRESWFESALMIASAMLSASFSSVILGLCMCNLVVVSRRLRIDPDNIASPIASSMGDLVTLTILTGVVTVLIHHFKSWLSTIILVILVASIPIFIVLTARNPYVNEILLQGWAPIIISLIITSGAGVLLRGFVDKYEGFALFTPVIAGLSGNLGCIYASRMSTRLQIDGEISPRNLIAFWTLFLLSIPISLLFLFMVWGSGQSYMSWQFMLFYSIITTVVVRLPAPSCYPRG
ncbi:Solute carrier family 41 member 1 [Neolecta irregularis DAH-3]|uniref:Solute carrier family 41 member 1 n=1 Tax=Neolecta irregularis (strain DAH-3) TaxID=1198029 RepID=A0A1U7LKV0_NEOID|nr:Solute carrier family 41 member 1 [Neolecta irregularis DAH-3]|eukprot:OLL23277.1 Solute carrier family 41 member 1 [Neolecta irregularis DAH-3]